MKIDPKIHLTGDSQPESVKTGKNAPVLSSSASKAAGLSPATGEDTVSLSSIHADVQLLAAGLAQVPEIRARQVAALQQQVRQGQYQPDNQKIADALITEHNSRVRKA